LIKHISTHKNHRKCDKLFHLGIYFPSKKHKYLNFPVKLIDLTIINIHRHVDRPLLLYDK